MRRYLVFAGSDFYPLGGFRDLAGEFDNAAAALGFALQWEAEHCSDGLSVWWEVVDTQDMRRINGDAKQDGWSAVTPGVFLE